MKKHTIEDIIKAEKKRQRLKTFKNGGWVGLALLLIGGFLIAFIANPAKHDGFFKGKVAGVHQRQSQNPRPTLLLVELSSGLRVTLKNSAHITAKIGKPVLVERRSRQTLKMSQYYFVRYMEESEEPIELQKN